jgi:hypothetical protein
MEYVLAYCFRKGEIHFLTQTFLFYFKIIYAHNLLFCSAESIVDGNKSRTALVQLSV